MNIPKKKVGNTARTSLEKFKTLGSLDIINFNKGYNFELTSSSI